MTSKMINVPGTLSAAREALADLNGLVTAKEWERAAIVYAFTRGDLRGRPSESDGNQALPISRFAELGIAGLTTRETVARYRRAWQTAIDQHKALPVQPDTITSAPDLEWGEVYVSERTERGRSESLEIPVSSDARMADWFAVNPEQAARVAQAALREAVADPDMAEQVLSQVGSEARGEVIAAISRVHEREDLHRSRPEPAPEQGPLSQTVQVAMAFSKCQRNLNELALLMQETSAHHARSDVRDGYAAASRGLHNSLDIIDGLITGRPMEAELADLLSGGEA